VLYETAPDSAEDRVLEAHLTWFLSDPSEEVDRFCEQVLAEATEDSDIL